VRKEWAPLFIEIAAFVMLVALRENAFLSFVQLARPAGTNG